MIKNVVTAFDLTPLDETLVKAIRQLPDADEIERLYFVHIMKDLNIPDGLTASFQKLFAPEQPLDERIKAEMAETVREKLGEMPGVRIDVDVIEGHPEKKLLEWVKLKNADLLVLGKKQVSGGGVVARRIASQAPCHTLFVPYEQEPKMEKVLVPIDFSKNSMRALELALAWKRKRPKLQITALHLAEYLPSGYYMNIKDQSRFNELVKVAAKEAFDEFLKAGKFDPGQMEIVIWGEEDGNISERILEFANLREMDTIVVGAKGHTALERFFFGSVTEHLLGLIFKQLVWIVR